jgi:hypothetical protein
LLPEVFSFSGLNVVANSDPLINGRITSGLGQETSDIQDILITMIEFS